MKINFKQPPRFRRVLEKRLVNPTDTDRTRKVTPLLREWFMQFAVFLSAHHIAMHCGVCRRDIAASHAWQHWGECSGYVPPLDDASGSSHIIKTQTGTLWVGARPLREELPAAQIEWMAQAHDVLPHFKIGLHCERCDADIAARNGADDISYSFACRCTELIGSNRDYVEMTVN